MPITDETIVALAEVLGPGDLVIDGGNSRYHRGRSARRTLAEKGIGFLDCRRLRRHLGLENGYGLMVGGSDEDVARVMPIFDALRPEGTRDEGFVHAGPVGAGHYAKMVHNGIEYGLMQAYAEGYELLAAEGHRHRRAGGHPGLEQRHRRPLLAARPAGQGAEEDPSFADIAGYIEDSGEGRWTVEEAIDHAVPMPVIAASLFARFASRQERLPDDEGGRGAAQPVRRPRRQAGSAVRLAHVCPTPGTARFPIMVGMSTSN